MSGCTACLRIIPARAGPTHLSLSVMVSAADHPRSCGANTLTLLRAIYPSGSSPLVRGQHQHDLLPTPFLRIIPARAGPTTGQPLPDIALADHPRSCGANFGDAFGVVAESGSSPLVRGQLDAHTYLSVCIRIIPARAGPTFVIIKVTQGTQDHPRSCGANLSFQHYSLYISGSSPLVRGQHAGIRHGHGRLRIIPARAGPTKYFRATHGSKTDHPRSCGANWAGDTHCACKVGSSPLVRGQPSTVK